MMKTLNVLESPVYPEIPECNNVPVGSIRRHEQEIADAAWLAGILDGEGCIATQYVNTVKNPNYYRSRIEVRNTDPYMLEKITAILSGWGVNFFTHFLKGRAGYKDGLMVIVTTYKGIQSLLLKVLPYLTAKQEEAQTMFEFVNWRLIDHPFKCTNGDNQKILKSRYKILHEALRERKRRRFGLQRLPRGGSQILDLTKLDIVESMV
jgi:hypothetical protein